MNLLEVALPKWPALAVVGAPVSREDAAEILIRTDSFYFSCNDHEWERQLYEAVGITLEKNEPYYISPNWDALRHAREEFRVLELSYIENWRVASSWIGGPHGWCNWDGTIGSSDHNVGKWPSVEEVLRDWQLVAAAFPVLDLRCQLYSGETCEEGVIPLVEYIVKDGRVELVAPGEPIPIVDLDMESAIGAIARSDPKRERGCTIEQFVAALGVVRRRNGK